MKDFVELSDVPVGSFLQLIKVPLNLLAAQTSDVTTPHSQTLSSANLLSALIPIFLVINEEVKQYLS